jgi:hypothetical protein
MKVIALVLLGVSVFLLVCVVVLYQALNLCIEERETWYQPLTPVEFDFLDAEVEDDE